MFNFNEKQTLLIGTDVELREFSNMYIPQLLRIVPFFDAQLYNDIFEQLNHYLFYQTDYYKDYEPHVTELGIHISKHGEISFDGWDEANYFKNQLDHFDQVIYVGEYLHKFNILSCELLEFLD